MRTRWKVTLFLGFLLLLVIITRQVSYTDICIEEYTEIVSVFKRDLVDWVNCNKSLGVDDRIDKTWTDLGDDLRIIINIASSEGIRVKITSKERVEYEKTTKTHYENFTVSGPQIIIEIVHPGMIIGRAAKMSGKIEIYHEYMGEEPEIRTREVNCTKYKFWWEK